MNRSRRDSTGRGWAIVVALCVAAASLAACADGDRGGDARAAPSLPPIVTTGPPTTSAPTTTVITPYAVREGDTLSAIASAHSVTVDAVLAANPEIASADDIHEGQVINVPSPAPITSPTVEQ